MEIETETKKKRKRKTTATTETETTALNKTIPGKRSEKPMTDGEQMARIYSMYTTIRRVLLVQ